MIRSEIKCDAAQAAAISRLLDDAEESISMAVKINDIFRKLGIFGRCSAYPTPKAETVAIQFHKDCTYAMVEVHAARFTAYCREHETTPSDIIAALRKKHELTTRNTPGHR